jgi:hypothetical protein
MTQSSKLETTQASEKHVVSNVEGTATLAELQSKLANAKRDLNNWVEKDAVRGDRSGAQDSRHEKIGDNKKKLVRDLEKLIVALGR